MAIDRTFASSIAGRYTKGIFGLGWTTPWQTSLSTDGSGDVTINSGGTLSYFSAEANGSFLATAGVYGALTRSAGIYTFTNTSGTQYVFLANGLLSYEQDTNGNVITLGYNGQNQLVTLTYSNPADGSEPSEQLTLTYNPQGFVSQVADGTGNVWTYAYDAKGHLLSVTAPGPTGAGLTTTYTYDIGSNAETANALLSITNADGSQQNFTYNATTGQLTGTSTNGGANAITLAYTYLGEGEVMAADGAGDKTTVWYNDLGLPSRVQDPLGGIYTYLYDTNGNLISSTDPAGDSQQYSYDSNGNLTQTVNALGQTVHMTYDALSDLTSLTDAGGNTTQYSYSSAGNLLDIAYPDGTQQSFSYDPLGNLSETVEQNGDAVSYQYNAQGLVAEEGFADGTSETFAYDAHGNLLTAKTYNASDTLTGTTTLTYNAANEVTAISYPGSLSLSFSYDAQGQRTQSVDQSGYTINYSYDSLGRLSELTDGSNDLIVQYSYNNVGQLAEKENGNGTFTIYAYDADGNLTGEVNYAPSTGGTNYVPADSTANSSFAYTYNSLNEQTSMTDAAGVTAYAYDATGQLTQVTLPGGATITYVYNASGDRTEVVSSGTTSYTSNDDNEITQVGSTTYTYNANGDLASSTTAGVTTTYTYNDLNQLLSISVQGGSTTTFQYSPLGFLVGTNVGGTQTNYLVDPNGLGNVVASYNGSGALIADFNYGLGLVRQTGPGGTGYDDFDGSGNTVGISGSSGAYVNQYSYLPFGETTTASAALPNPFTFAGQSGVMQIGNNLFYMRARDYSPATGQFLSNDPTGLAGGDTNLRRYVGNNPVSSADPSGLNSSFQNAISYDESRINAAQAYLDKIEDQAGLLPDQRQYFEQKGIADSILIYSDPSAYHKLLNELRYAQYAGQVPKATAAGHRQAALGRADGQGHRRHLQRDLERPQRPGGPRRLRHAGIHPARRRLVLHDRVRERWQCGRPGHHGQRAACREPRLVQFPTRLVRLRLAQRCHSRRADAVPDHGQLPELRRLVLERGGRHELQRPNRPLERDFHLPRPGDRPGPDGRLRRVLVSREPEPRR